MIIESLKFAITGVVHFIYYIKNQTVTLVLQMSINSHLRSLADIVIIHLIPMLDNTQVRNLCVRAPS